jgi:D-alanyl-lipoteichoic acid acyltransferase DltB (MBOAT superfamily)
LPQVKRKREVDYAKMVDGLRQMLWGLFKKIVIADNCAEFANTIFNDHGHQSGSTLVVGALMFTFQIYCDFSGYSDIALGTARLFGIDLLRNFAFPYFSRDIAEFWRRWHISLSTWFRDYLYIPLGGSKGGTWMKVRNTFVIFLVSGFWHGANWTFIFWGFLNALYFMPLLLLGWNRTNIGTVAEDRMLPSVREFFQMAVTFAMAAFAWIFFRAASLADAFQYVAGIFNKSLFSKPAFLPKPLILLIGFFLVIEWIGRREQYALAKFALRWPRPLRWTFYYGLIVVMLLYMGKEQEFIYFQF